MTGSEAIAAAYRSAIDAYSAAAAVSDPWHPGLEATHVNPMLDRRRQGLVARQADGEVVEAHPDTRFSIYDVEVDRNDASVARLRFCLVDHDMVVKAATGEVVNGRVLTTHGRAAMRYVEGTWRLAERLADDQAEGDQGCPPGL